MAVGSAGPKKRGGVAPAEIRRIVAAVEESFEPLLAKTVEAIWAEVPAYSANPDPRLRQESTEHIAAIFRVLLTTLTQGRPAVPADFTVTRDHALRRP